jgi:choline dehydrogenase-like flavoprotein
MASTDYDIITIGGGLGGAALAKTMAEHGARVLVLESELHFKDRIRGEVMMSWGVADAKALGIYECMKAAGGVEVEYGEQSQNGGDPVRRHLPTSTI